MSSDNQGGQSGGQQAGGPKPAPAGIIGQAGVPVTGTVQRSDNPPLPPNVNITTKVIRNG